MNVTATLINVEIERGNCASMIQYLENKVIMLQNELDLQVQVEIKGHTFTISSPVTAILNMININNTIASLIKLRNKCNCSPIWR